MPLRTYIGWSSTNTYTRAHSSPFTLSGTCQPTAVYWLWPLTHKCALLLFALHSLYPDSGISLGRILKKSPDPDYGPASGTPLYTSQDIRYCICTSGMVASLIFMVTLASKSIHFSSKVLLVLKNGVICLKFSDITLESCYLIYNRPGLTFAIFILVGIVSIIVKPEKLKIMCLCSITDL